MMPFLHKYATTCGAVLKKVTKSGLLPELMEFQMAEAYGS